MRARFPFGNFPFVVPHVSSQDFSGITPVPLAVAMRWYWRVRAWQIQLTMSGNVSGYDEYGRAYSMQISGNTVTSVMARDNFLSMDPYHPFAPGAPQTEADLVGYTGGGVFNLRSPSVVDVSPASITPPLDQRGWPITFRGGGSVGMDWFLDPTSASLGYDPETGMYLPFPQISGGASVEALSLYAENDSVLVGLVTVGRSVPPYPVIQAPLTIDGYEAGAIAGFYGLKQGSPYGGDASYRPLIGSLSATVDLTPVEYWAYADVATGTPLYDTHTGQPAINPTTGVAFTLAEIAAASIP